MIVDSNDGYVHQVGADGAGSLDNVTRALDLGCADRPSRVRRRVDDDVDTVGRLAEALAGQYVPPRPGRAASDARIGLPGKHAGLMTPTEQPRDEVGAEGSRSSSHQHLCHVVEEGQPND